LGKPFQYYQAFFWKFHMTVFEGWTFRMIRRGPARAAPIVIASPAEAPSDPMKCARLALVPHDRAVRSALATATIASGSVAFVCASAVTAARLAGRLFQGGAVEIGAVV
jgi:hypothetical protein